MSKHSNFLMQLQLTKNFNSLRTFLHRVQAPPTKKGSDGPVQKRRKYKPLSEIVTIDRNILKRFIYKLYRNTWMIKEKRRRSDE